MNALDDAINRLIGRTTGLRVVDIPAPLPKTDDANAKSGNGAVPTGSYTLLVPANFKRRWFAVTVPSTEVYSMLLVLNRTGSFSSADSYTNILVEPGSSVVLSRTGDMPWLGAIYATGLSANTSCYWSEVEDYP